MSEKKPERIQAELVTRAQDRRGNQELVFDPTSGELVLRRPSENLPNPDATVIDSIAEDGFFARL